MATSILGFDPERCQAPASVRLSMGEEDSRHLIRSVLLITTDLLEEREKKRYERKKAFDVPFWKKL